MVLYGTALNMELPYNEAVYTVYFQKGFFSITVCPSLFQRLLILTLLTELNVFDSENWIVSYATSQEAN